MKPMGFEMHALPNILTGHNAILYFHAEENKKYNHNFLVKCILRKKSGTN